MIKNKHQVHIGDVEEVTYKEFKDAAELRSEKE